MWVARKLKSPHLRLLDTHVFFVSLFYLFLSFCLFLNHFVIENFVHLQKKKSVIAPVKAKNSQGDNVHNSRILFDTALVAAVATILTIPGFGFHKLRSQVFEHTFFS
jgi:hypothetical protein